MFTPVHLIFDLFAALAIVSALFVITAKNPVRSVLALVVTFFSMAGVWMLLEAEFLALILILVYVGAVMTLFLFVVMMLNINTESSQSGFVRYLPIGLILVALFATIMIGAVDPHYFGLGVIAEPLPSSASASNTAQLGMLLYTDYAYPFEIAGVILLVAIIAAITLAHRKPHSRRMQDVSLQIKASPRTGVRLVKMPSEPKQDT